MKEEEVKERPREVWVQVHAQRGRVISYGRGGRGKGRGEKGRGFASTKMCSSVENCGGRGV